MKQHYLKVIVTALIGLSVLRGDPIRIMPLGDSITYDNLHVDIDTDNPRPVGVRTAYRSHLWYMLEDANYDVDFVGSVVAGQSIKPPFDPDNEGHPSWTSYDIASKVYGYLAQNPADIILLHIGTNDLSISVNGVDSILNEISRFEDDTGHTVRVIVALIIDRQEHSETISIFNNNLKQLIESRIGEGDLLTLVDMYHGAGLTRGDYADRTHPNSSGYLKMAKMWFGELMKPYSAELHTFPYTLVEESYIQSMSFTDNSVEFVTEVPNDGIIF